MEEEDAQKEMQLLHQSGWMPGSSERSQARASGSCDGPSLDLQLSISLRPFQQPSDCIPARPLSEHDLKKCTDFSCVEALKWQAAEQIRLAAMEKAYAERVRELSRQEMELAHSEFARARQIWEGAQEAVEKSERMKKKATRHIDSTCMEITCHACRRRFRP